MPDELTRVLVSHHAQAENTRRRARRPGVRPHTGRLRDEAALRRYRAIVIISPLDSPPGTERRVRDCPDLRLTGP